MRVSFKKHERKDFVDVCTGHDGKDVVSREATEEDRKRWPEEYAAYVGAPAATAGVVLDEVPVTTTKKAPAKPKGKE